MPVTPANGKAVAADRLDFGGVDIVRNASGGDAVLSCEFVLAGGAMTGLAEGFDVIDAFMTIAPGNTQMMGIHLFQTGGKELGGH